MANTFHYIRGGDCKYTFELSKLLEDRGHRVIPFAMHHPQNFQSPYSRFFVPEIDLAEELKKKSFSAGVRVLKRTIYSNLAKKKLSGLLDTHDVDIAHIQNIHGHITPSIFHLLKKRNIPIVWTLHDYFLLCPNSTFYSKNTVCEACKGNRFYSAVIRRCRKDSFAASIIVMLGEYVHRLLGLLKAVDYFISPSRFMRDKFIQYGFPAERVIYLPHFMPDQYLDSSPKKEEGGYLLYVGRLSYEKGLSTLIKAVSLVESALLYIVGTGPMKYSLEKVVTERRLNDRIKFLGYIADNNKLGPIYRRASAVVFPSECFETFGLGVIEGFLYGKPVIGGDLGAVKELIKHRETGLLFEPGNAHDLAEKIKWLLDHPEERREMGMRARELVLEKYNPHLHYKQLIKIYKKALERHKTL